MKAVMRLVALFVLFVIALLAWDNHDEIAASIRRIKDPNLYASTIEDLSAEFEVTEKAARTGSVAELASLNARAKADLAARERELAKYKQDHEGPFSQLNPLNRLDPESGRLEIRAKAARSKVALLSRAEAAAQNEGNLLAGLPRASDRLRMAAARCNATAAEVAKFDKLPTVQKTWRRIYGKSRADLMRENKAACDDWKSARKAYGALTDSLGKVRSLRGSAAESVARVRRDLAGEWQNDAERGLRASTSRFWTENDMRGVLWRAFYSLILAMLSPYIIRTIFYFVLAPIAQRRAAIKISVPGISSTIPPVATSAASVSVRIAGGRELLVREGFLQSSSTGGTKRWRAVLDWRHPVASWATKLTGLTRIRGSDETVTISASADPFAEVAKLTLPAGTSLALHPRALVAVVQPISSPLKISSHWRIFSLNAWLTLQLRYLVFHGPADLVIQGGRGIRAEKAVRGRTFAQDQLVGFSSDLSYSVSRNETFIPYLLGKVSLFRDKVDGGEGVLIIEEAPLALRGGGPVKGGLEGAFDAALKAFGL